MKLEKIKKKSDFVNLAKKNNISDQKTLLSNTIILLNQKQKIIL